MNTSGGRARKGSSGNTQLRCAPFSNAFVSNDPSSDATTHVLSSNAYPRRTTAGDDVPPTRSVLTVVVPSLVRSTSKAGVFTRQTFSAPTGSELTQCRLTESKRV